MPYVKIMRPSESDIISVLPKEYIQGVLGGRYTAIACTEKGGDTSGIALLKTRQDNAELVYLRSYPPYRDMGVEAGLLNTLVEQYAGNGIFFSFYMYEESEEENPPWYKSFLENHEGRVEKKEDIELYMQPVGEIILNGRPIADYSDGKGCYGIYDDRMRKTEMYDFFKTVPGRHMDGIVEPERLLLQRFDASSRVAIDAGRMVAMGLTERVPNAVKLSFFCGDGRYMLKLLAAIVKDIIETYGPDTRLKYRVVNGSGAKLAQTIFEPRYLHHAVRYTLK